jgi:Ca-activated chloride channel family protein
MIDFAWPWSFLILPLPLFLFKLSKVKKEQYISIYSSTLPFLSNTTTGEKAYHKIPFYLLIILWIVLIVTLARPQWLSEPIIQTLPTRDLMLAVDVSKSMSIQDASVDGKSDSRINMVKSYLQSFVQQRKGDRIGTIVFADHAYLMIPFTTDWNATSQLLSEINVGLVGNFTAIGEAITLAVKKMLHEPLNNKVLILLSDGRDTVNTISPINAAKLAKASGLKIFTIGIGSDPTDDSNDIPSDLDENTLEKIANLTGGQYFRARSEQDLSEIYQQINLIEPLSLKSVTYQPYKDLIVWPLSLLLLLTLILLWIIKND